MKPTQHHQLTPQEKQRIETAAQRKRKREDSGDAFVREGEPVTDDLAEDLAEGYLASATSGEESHSWLRDDDGNDDDLTVTSGNKEFAGGTDEMNPPDAEPAEQPTVGRWQPFKKPD